MFRIGELARRAECLVPTVRYYEAEGLLPDPPRTEGKFRLYDESDLERLLFIRRCRAKNMNLAEIRRLLSFRDRPELGCAEVNDLMDAHIEQVRAQIRELQALERQLFELRSSCDSNRCASQCGILNGLAETS